LGWFDGNPENLYPMEYDEESYKTILMMGGSTKIITAITDAQSANDHRWALHLLKILRAASHRDHSSE